MSLTTMSAWYMERWVKAPWPAASPTAHTPVVPSTRRWSSTGSARAEASRPMEPTLSWTRSGRRVGGHQQPVGHDRLPGPEGHGEAVPVMVHRLDGHPGADVDPLGPEHLGQQ